MEGKKEKVKKPSREPRRMGNPKRGRLSQKNLPKHRSPNKL